MERNGVEYRVVCGVCIVKCTSLKSARREAKRFDRGVIDELIDVKEKGKWSSLCK